MFITEKEFGKLRDALSEKSTATGEKYFRDITAFVGFCGNEITKENICAYRRMLTENYKPRSANSMIAAVNFFLDVIGMRDMKIKSVKIQREVFCPEEKELTRAEYERLCRAARERKKTARL